MLEELLDHFPTCLADIILTYVSNTVKIEINDISLLTEESLQLLKRDCESKYNLYNTILYNIICLDNDNKFILEHIKQLRKNNKPNRELYCLLMTYSCAFGFLKKSFEDWVYNISLEHKILKKYDYNQKGECMYLQVPENIHVWNYMRDFMIVKSNKSETFNLIDLDAIIKCAWSSWD